MQIKRTQSIVQIQRNGRSRGGNDPGQACLGSKDNSVRARMLRESNLNLTNAIDMCRTSERTSQHLQKLTPLVTSSVPAQQGVNAVKSHKVSKFKKKFANKSDESKQKPHHNVVKSASTVVVATNAIATNAQL